MLRDLKTVFAKPPAMAVLLLLIVLAAGTSLGLYRHVLHEWEAAQRAVKEGQPADARSHLKVCLLVWPRSFPVHLLAARAARLNGEFPEAEAHLNRCLKLQKEATADVELEFLLLRLQAGEVDTVAPTLWQCVEQHHPETPLILETLAQAYIHNLRYGPALTCLDRCIREAPDRAEPLYWRGWIFERLSDREEALKNYQKAVEFNPDLVPARLRLAELYLQLSNAQEALPHLERLARQCSHRPDITARRGHCRFLLGEMEEARRLLESAVEKLPDDLPLLIQLGRLENQQGHPDRAEKWLRHALAIDPTDPEARYLLANSLQAQDRLEEAEAAREQHRKDVARLKRINQLLQEAARHPLTDPNALFEIGSLFLHGGQARLGLYWLHQALEHDEAHQPTHQALAEYYEKQGDNKQAEAHRRWLRESSGKKDPATK